MNTMQEIETVKGESLSFIELEGALLLELLEGVSTHAGRDKILPTLNAVEVEGGGGLLVARATDRYRLIEGGARVLEGSLDKALISLEDTKRVIALAKAHKPNLVSITRLGNSLTVSSLGDSLSVTLLGGIFPPTAHLFEASEGEASEGKPNAVEGVAFNPAFMADYGKIAGKGAAIKIYFTGEGKPMRVRITSDTINWRALLMPMRYKD
jgi:DNA polymerase III sliding clamp (beta) subunit (PCNA family)